jgi:hypothetical protein
MDKKFNVEHQFQLFLERVELSEEYMSFTQRKVMRDTFFGAWGQLILLLIVDIPELPDVEGMKALDNMKIQVYEHFIKGIDSITGKEKFN